MSKDLFLIIIAERATREKEGTTTRSLIKSFFFSKSEFRERDTKKSKPRVFFFGSAQFLSSRDATLRLSRSRSFLLIIADLFVLRARALLPFEKERERERERERKKERSEVKEEEKNEEPFRRKEPKREQTRESF